MRNKTSVWNRLLKALDADNLDEAADKLDINPSTLRGRKARGSLPYDKIVHKLDAKMLVYVFKNEKISIDSQSSDNTFNQKNLHYEISESAFEQFLTDLTKRIEAAPFSTMAKLKIIDSIIHIVEQDLEKVRLENQNQ